MGNPLTSENAAFRWLVVVLVAAVSVGLVAKVFGSTAGIFYGMVLLAIVSVMIAKGMMHLLGNPENDPPEEDEDPPAAGRGGEPPAGARQGGEHSGPDDPGSRPAA